MSYAHRAPLSTCYGCDRPLHPGNDVTPVPFDSAAPSCAATLLCPPDSSGQSPCQVLAQLWHELGQRTCGLPVPGPSGEPCGWMYHPDMAWSQGSHIRMRRFAYALAAALGDRWRAVRPPAAVLTLADGRAPAYAAMAVTDNRHVIVLLPARNSEQAELFTGTTGLAPSPIASLPLSTPRPDPEHITVVTVDISAAIDVPATGGRQR
ncbi:hypothetical protein ACWDUL_20880 [Nocardia niigatensis]